MKPTPLRPSILLVSVLCLSAWAATPPLPITESAVVKIVESGPDRKPSFVYRVFAWDETDPESEYYRVAFDLIPTNSAAPLRAADGRIDFLAQEPIGFQHRLYRDGGGSDWLGLSVFDNMRVEFDSEWQYYDVGAQVSNNTLYYRARNLTEVYVGYRFSGRSGTHFGWMKFARNDTGFTNAFDLVADDWNPIPGAPISAGLPPEIPLSTTVTSGSLLQVRWDRSLTSWIFETTGDLTPPVTWTRYPSGAVAAEVPLGGNEAHRYFRLRPP